MADQNTQSSVDQELTQESKPNEQIDVIKDKDIDKELDDLLDSALEDFDKPPPVSASSSDVPPTATEKESSEQTPSVPLPTQDGNTADLSNQQEALFNELFKAAGTDSSSDAAALEEMMKQLMSNQSPDFMQPFGQATSGVESSLPQEGSGSFEETLQKTLGSMAQNTQNLQSSSPEADLMQMLSGLGLDEGGGDGGEMGDLDFLPMMQGMMKSLMSKEVLYPSLKEISDKYPAWLEENSSKVAEKDLVNYKKQYEYMKAIVVEFESEKETDSDDVKSRRFSKIMDTMQQMQELGHPPKELVGDMPAGMELDENGLPKMLPNMEQCSVM